MRSTFSGISIRIGLPLLAAICSSGCGDSVGECDGAAANELVYSSNGLVATKGQALVHDSCGNGAFCHSSGARGSARYGAPHGMNFDMLPSPTGWPHLMDRREDAWQLVVARDMPPRDLIHKVGGDGHWVFDAKRGSDATALPSLASDEGKSALRNWLACGAPIVANTKLPDWVQAQADSDDDAGTAADFETIYSSILRPNCATAGCHSASAAGSLKMLDACSAHRELLNPGPCGGPRVVPGDGESLLLQKLESRTPACGGPMPPSAALPSSKIAAVRAWVVAGAEPPSCP